MSDALSPQAYLELLKWRPKSTSASFYSAATRTQEEKRAISDYFYEIGLGNVAFSVDYYRTPT